MNIRNVPMSSTAINAEECSQRDRCPLRFLFAAINAQRIPRKLSERLELFWVHLMGTHCRYNKVTTSK